MADYRDMLPSWMRPRWPRTAKELLTSIGVGLAALGLSGYLYVRTFHDYLWDDFIFYRRALRYGNKLMKMMKAGGGIYDSALRLEELARSSPNKHFLLFEDQKHTYAETNTRANEIASTLQRLGVTREQRLAVLMKNKPELLFVLHGCHKLALPLSLLNTNIRTKSLVHCIKEGATKNVLVDDDPELLSAMDEVQADLEAEGIRVFVYGQSDRYESFTDAMEGADTTNPDPAIRKGVGLEDIAVFLFTSGTTGLPKAARLTMKRYGLFTGAAAIMGLQPDDIVYAPLPLYHSSSLGVFQSAVLFNGGTLAFAPKFSATKFWEDCDKHGATVMQYIGETCRYLLTKPPSDSDRKHKIRLAIGNGLRKDIWQEFKDRFNVPVIGEFYGMTEGNLFLGNMRNKLGSCGRLHSPKARRGTTVLFIQYDSEMDTVVRGADGLCKVVPRGVPGLLVSEITSLAPFDGYTDRSQSERKVLRNVLVEGDAYFNSGDILLWDTDYYVYFVDRIGDTFRWKGENVATVEVANLLNDLDIIMDCTVYGVSIPGMDGRCGMAAIVLKSGTEPTSEVLKAMYKHCEQYLPGYARPIFIRFMSELHLTGTYKHQKFKLQQEGFDYDKVTDVYVHDVKLSTYIPLTSHVYESILNGSMKV